MTFPNLFDLVGGPLLDKQLLAQGIRVGSMRRCVLVAMAIVVFRRVWMDGLEWPAVAAVTAVIVGRDLQGAVAADPKEAIRMVGDMVGRARAGMQSSYQYATSAWQPPTEEEDVPPEAS